MSFMRKQAAAFTFVLTLTGALGSGLAEKPKAPARSEPPPPQAATKPEPPAEVRGPSARGQTNDTAKGAELSEIEGELATLMDELVSARARAGVLARALFKTELSVELDRRAKAQSVRHVVLQLDGVPVHDSDGSALAANRVQLFTGYVTPGRHELAVEIVEASKDDASYGYTRSEHYLVEVKKDARTRVQLIVRDDSDMAEEALEGDEGEYHVETTVRVTSERAAD